MNISRKFGVTVAGAVLLAVGIEGAVPKRTPGSVAAAVSVVNTPLPVTGNVNATISGTPTVNVGSAPPVNVNFPNSIGINGPVGVENPKGAFNLPLPLIQQDFENPARSAFQASCTAACVNGFLTCDLANIPSTKTLVIETVSASMSIDSPNFPARVIIVTKAGGIFANHYLSPVLVGSMANGISYYAVTANVKLYADPTVVSGTVVTNSNSASAYFTISGHFVCTNFQAFC
jgi:hypothetical protein